MNTEQEQEIQKIKNEFKDLFKKDDIKNKENNIKNKEIKKKDDYELYYNEYDNKVNKLVTTKQFKNGSDDLIGLTIEELDCLLDYYFGKTNI